MRDELFDVPLSIAIGRQGSVSNLTGAVSAAAFLVDSWPDDRRGPKYRSAVKSCMDVLEGRKRVASARKALLAAAREAGIPVSDSRP